MAQTAAHGCQSSSPDAVVAYLDEPAWERCEPVDQLTVQREDLHGFRSLLSPSRPSPYLHKVPRGRIRSDAAVVGRKLSRAVPRTYRGGLAHHYPELMNRRGCSQQSDGPP